MELSVLNSYAIVLQSCIFLCCLDVSVRLVMTMTEPKYPTLNLLGPRNFQESIDFYFLINEFGKQPKNRSVWFGQTECPD